MKPRISVVLLTTGRQPLLRFSILSLLPQSGEGVNFSISINSTQPSEIGFVKNLAAELDPGGVFRILQPGSQLSVYEHYRFALDQSSTEIVLIAHDDEIYHSGLIAELQMGFSDPAVSMVAGGLLKVEPGRGKNGLIPANFRPQTAVLPGLEWLKSAADIYPPFCFSALTLHKRFLDPGLFLATSTSADCLAVTHQAIGGKVYHSDKIFATWLQLPSRNSRWYALRPGLTATWKEYSNYFSRIADPDLLHLSAAAKINSGRMFLRMLLCVAVLRSDAAMINTSLSKLEEIHPLKAKILGFLRYPVFHRPLSVLLRPTVGACRWAGRLLGSNPPGPSPDGAALLKLDRLLWESYLQTATGTA